MTNQPDEKLIRKIEALLNVKGCTEAEAEARIAKAQELLAKYNLDMASIGGTPAQNKRNDKKTKGGLYSWQRKLWKAVAELNFCHYLSVKGLAKGSTYEHRLIGSHGNVIATEVMANYLQETIEKLAQAWAKESGYKSVFVRDAIAYREGMTNRVAYKLKQRRDAVLEEERKATEERKQREAASGQASTSHALTLVEYTSSEQDFNNDYLNNWELGTTAKNRYEAELRQKKWEEEYRARQAAKTDEEKEAERKATEEWYAEYQKKQAKAQKRRDRTPPKAQRERKRTPEEERAGLWAFREGQMDGDKVGIDQQATNERRGAIE